jgi:hypothetical protein
MTRLSKVRMIKKVEYFRSELDANGSFKCGRLDNGKIRIVKTGPNSDIASQPAEARNRSEWGRVEPLIDTVVDNEVVRIEFGRRSY